MSNLFYLNSNPELKGKTAGNAIVNNISVDEEMAPLPEPITNGLINVTKDFKWTKTIRNDIEEYIKKNEDYKPELGYAVRIDKFADSSIDMYVRCFTKTDDWDEWLAVKERLAIQIKQIVEKNGASFAFPSQSIYVEKK